MRIDFLIVGVSCLLGATACTKAKAEKPPAPTCSATAWKEPSGLFCIDAPGFTADSAPTDDSGGTTTRVMFDKPGADGTDDLVFFVSWAPDQDASGMTKLSARMDRDYRDEVGEENGTLAGGRGKYILYATQGDRTAHKLYAAVAGNKHVYACRAKSYGRPMPPELLAACKSLIATD